MEAQSTHERESMRCPGCRQWMQSGHVAISHGVMWLRNADSSHLPFSESVPGTHALMRANRLPAWRCPSCELLLFRFGRDVHKHHDHEKLNASDSAES
jgi:hypothetical protein